MGKEKDRELVVLLLDRKEMLPKPGVPPEYENEPEGSSYAEELDSPLQCWCR